MTDHLVAGRVRLRLDGDGPAERALVARETGLDRPVGAAGDADMTVRFVDRLRLTGPVHFVGADSGFTPEGLVLLPGRFAAHGRTLLPLDALDGPPVLVCERGATALPLLVELLNVAALRHGILPLHAAAAELAGTGLLLTGWAKGGKTEAVLGLSGLGARVVGDEWVHLTPTGAAVSLPHPVRAWRWHVEQLPELRRKLARRDRVRLRTTAALLPVADRLPWPRSLAEILREADGAYLPLPTVSGTAGHRLDKVDRLVLVGSRADDALTVEPVAGLEVAERMRHSLAHERRHLTDAYRKLRFAFPERRSRFLDRDLPALERDLLHARLGPLPAYRVLHPYPVDLRRFAAAIAALAEVATAAGTPS